MTLSDKLGLRRPPYRILTLDGGGVRGIVSLIWLERLEQHLRGRVHGHIDLIAGTSVGAVIGCALAMGLSAEEVRGMWVGAAHTTFSKPSRLGDHLRRVANLGGMAPKYEDTGLVHMLKSVFGDKRMGDLGRPTLALSYCPQNMCVQVFSTMREDHLDLPVWEVCRASTAAPLFFSPYNMVIDESGEEMPLIDGGVTANNPVIVALSAAVGQPSQQVGLADVVVASFGTGQPTEGKRDVPKTIFGHGSLITQALFQGATGTDHATAQAMLPARSYWRFQTTLPPRLQALDEADNIDDLIALAYQHLANGADLRLRQLARRMLGKPERPGWIERMTATRAKTAP